MLEEILREIEEMVYPSEGIGCGLEDEEIIDRYDAAAYGFEEAKKRILEIIHSYSNDWWIYCGDGKNLPDEDGYYLCSFNEGSCAPFVSTNEYKDRLWRYGNPIAWRPLPAIYHPTQKSISEDYKQQIMERFLKVE